MLNKGDLNIKVGPQHWSSTYLQWLKEFALS